MPPRRTGVLLGLALLLAASMLLAVGLGAVPISPWAVLRLVGWKLHLAGPPTDLPDSTAVILFQLRLPRVLLAAEVGAALATAGAVFQALFRNPMADPAIIGVSSGAALGAIAVILAGAGGAWREGVVVAGSLRAARGDRHRRGRRGRGAPQPLGPGGGASGTAGPGR